LKRLKIILQSKKFLAFSLFLIILYVLLFTKFIKYSSIYLDESLLEGIILEYNTDGDKLRMLIKAKEKVQSTYYFSSIEEKTQIISKLKLGLKVKLVGKFNEPLNNTIPNTFNYKNYLYNKKIYKTFQISNLELTNNNISFLYKIKNMFIKKVNSYKNINSYMQAFILGDKDYINSDVYQNFRNNGVTHLFAVSGMHVSFLVLAISFLLKRFKIKDNVINIGIIIFLLFYMFLIGFSASVVRASLLFILIFINKSLHLNLNNLNILYLLFIFLLLINPFFIYDLGFVYSFLTSFGLILFSTKIKGNYIVKLFSVSLIATLFSLPVTLLNFYEFNLMTIFNNVIIVPIVSVVLFPLTIITFIMPFLEPILVIGFEVLEYISVLCNKLALMIVVPKINIIFIILYYVFIYLIYKKGFKFLIGIIFLIVICKLLPYLNNNAYIYYLDVGQGDASLIITEHRKDIIMIDTGGVINYSKEEWQLRNNSFNLADNIISFLKSLGITKLDLLIITHGDIDHLGYAEDIIKEITIDTIMLNNNHLNTKEQELLKKVNKRIINNYKRKNIVITNLNKTNLKDENDSSLVLSVSLKQYNLLFMGDAPKKIEQDIINNYSIRADILKVGHHGSNTSTDIAFLEAINPNIAIISAGRNNRYNHPSPETIANLNALKINYFNTKENGTIKFILGKNKKISFYPP